MSCTAVGCTLRTGCSVLLLNLDCPAGTLVELEDLSLLLQKCVMMRQGREMVWQKVHIACRLGSAYQRQDAGIRRTWNHAQNCCRLLAAIGKSHIGHVRCVCSALLLAPRPCATLAVTLRPLPRDPCASRLMRSSSNLQFECCKVQGDGSACVPVISAVYKHDIKQLCRISRRIKRNLRGHVSIKTCFVPHWFHYSAGSEQQQGHPVAPLEHSCCASPPRRGGSSLDSIVCKTPYVERQSTDLDLVECSDFPAHPKH